MNILITGGSGFIGRNLIEKLNPLYNIYYPTSKELNLMDSGNVNSWFSNKSFDCIIHCAMHDPFLKEGKNVNHILTNNLHMFFNLMRERNRFDKFINLGTMAEYNKDNLVLNMSEDYFDKYMPKEDYGFSKSIISKFIETTDNAINLRLFGVFGKYEDKKRFISNSILNIIEDKDIIINRNIKFDYLCVNDLVDIIEWFIENNAKEKVYNVCTSNPIEIKVVAEKLLKIFKKNNSILINNNEGNIAGISGNNSRLLKEIKNYNFTPIEKSLTYMCNYLKG